MFFYHKGRLPTEDHLFWLIKLFHFNFLFLVVNSKFSVKNEKEVQNAFTEQSRKRNFLFPKAGKQKYQKTEKINISIIDLIYFRFLSTHYLVNESATSATEYDKSPILSLTAFFYVIQISK